LKEERFQSAPLDMKAREMIFRPERSRIHRIRGRRRNTAEEQRCELKHRRQLELRAAADSSVKELEQMQNEKRKMLMEHETMKLKPRSMCTRLCFVNDGPSLSHV
jgi:STE20-like kinase